MNLLTSDADRGAEFSDDDYNDAYPPGYELHYWHRARGSIVSGLVRSFCKKGDMVLEIGAGRGHYVRLLRGDGFDAYGCDLGSPKVHEDMSAFVFSRTGFADLAFSLRQRVTAILLLDVIEHIERPTEFIASALESLPAVRWLIITVPARHELWSNYDEHYRHFLRYDAQQLLEVVQKSSLSISAWSYFFHALYLPAWLLNKAGLNRATAFAAPKTPWLHKWLGYAFWLESKLVPNRFYGTSLVCVCRPNE
jgi:2-polyprenyl-3-methyl-5-hydroxy-6-metoxy-1,4-benzoquinol methylase